ncbi:MAG: PAS domain-containing protein [bacterium]
MSMKFWFKKDTEQNASRGAACDALAISCRTGNDGALLSTLSQLFVAPQRAEILAEAKIAMPQSGGSGSATCQEPVPAAVTEGESQAEAASTGPAVSAAGQVTPAETQKVALKPVLKPVGGLVRLAARPTDEAAAVAPPRAAASATGMADKCPTCGLRPQAATGAAAAVDKGVVVRDADGVLVEIRPKVDQRALYYQLMNGLYDAVLVLDAHGHVVDCNSRVTEMLGYSREEAWDMPIRKVITGMASQMFEHLKRNLAENHHLLIDARCFRKDGTSFAGEVGVCTISLTTGNNMVFAIRNVERRKSAMDDLRKSQAALDIALASAFVCDADGFFVVVNQALLDAFGMQDADQAKGVRFMDLLPDAARHFLRASCGEKVRETVRVPTSDGRPVNFQLALVPVQNGQNIAGVAGSILRM